MMKPKPRSALKDFTTPIGKQDYPCGVGHLLHYFTPPSLASGPKRASRRLGFRLAIRDETRHQSVSLDKLQDEVTQKA
jgi:hypothetical protein